MEVSKEVHEAWIAGIDEGVSRNSALAAAQVPAMTQIRALHRNKPDDDGKRWREVPPERAAQLVRDNPGVYQTRQLFAASAVDSPMVLPEPVAYLHECGKKPSLRTFEFSKVAIQLSAKGYKSHGLYTEQQVRALLATGGQAQAGAQDAEWFATKAEALVVAAKSAGFVITIENLPKTPLAMGNAEMCVSVRQSRAAIAAAKEGAQQG